MELLTLIRERQPNLLFDVSSNSFAGTFYINNSYRDKPRIQDSYEIAFCLNNKMPNSILPIVTETGGKIKRIAVRKNLPLEELHINQKGELCLMIPELETERFNEGFDLMKFIDLLEEHFYWVSYFDNYDIAPWPGQAHGDEGYVELYIQDSRKYGKVVKRILGATLTRPDFRRLMKEKVKRLKIKK